MRVHELLYISGWQKRAINTLSLLYFENGRHLGKDVGPWEQDLLLNINFFKVISGRVAVAPWIRYWTADPEVASSSPARNVKIKFLFVIPSLNNYKNLSGSHKFACTNVTPKKNHKNRAETLTHAATAHD